MNNHNYQYSLLQDEEPNPIASTAPREDDMNNLVVWLDEKAFNSTLPNTRLTIDMFKSVPDTNYKLYDNGELFLMELENMSQEMKLIIVTSGRFADRLLPELSLELLRKISAILIYCKETTKYQYLLRQYRKVIDVCADEQSLKEAIEDELHPLANFLVMDRDLKALFSLKDNSHHFHIYRQFIEILKYYPWSKDNRKKMLDECTKHYRKNHAQRRKIEEFKYTYTSERAVEWYTRDSFLYRLVNKALRSLDMEQINIFRPYIKDLCKQIEHLHKQNQSDTSLTLYRGHGNMTRDEFDKIKENIGAWVSFNGFQSASTDERVAIAFAGSESSQKVSVLYEIRTKSNLKNAVFADITHLSYMRDEKEFLFNLCSIFRIDDIVKDNENQLSRIIMSAFEEDVVHASELSNIEIIEEDRKPWSHCIHQHCRKQFIIRAFVSIVFVVLLTLGVSFIYNFKRKDQPVNTSNCVGANCTTLLSTTKTAKPGVTNTQSTTSTISPGIISKTSQYSVTDPSATETSTNTVSITTECNATNGSASTDCVSFGWTDDGDVVANSAVYGRFAVDDDLNVYIVNVDHRSLDKLSSEGKLIVRLFEGQFDDATPLFFHSSSQSLYFCYVWNDTSGVFRIAAASFTPTANTTENIIIEVLTIPKTQRCNELYVNAPGEIFIFDRSEHLVHKWAVNSFSAILVADEHNLSPTVQRSFAQYFTVDEANNAIFLVDHINKRILKYINGSPSGTIIIDGSPVQMLSSIRSTNINPLSIAVDKTGYIVVGEEDRVTAWTSDGRFYRLVLKKYRHHRVVTEEKIYAEKLLFDRSGNLYVFNGFFPKLMRFNRTLST